MVRSRGRKQCDVHEELGALEGCCSTKPEIGGTDSYNQRGLQSLSPGGLCMPREGILLYSDCLVFLL